MKKTLILLSILTSFVASAQSIEINPNGGTNASAVLDLKSTTKGFLPPRMTNEQMRAIPNPAQGLLAFCTNCGTTANGEYYFFKGTAWVLLSSTTVSSFTSVGAVSDVASSQGATVTSDGVLNLAPANATNPGIVTKTDQTFGGVKTFSSGIVGNVTGNVTGNLTGNAATVTTNANLTGVVTSTGNATSIANGAISNAMLANGAVTNLSGTNTGDNAVNSLYSGLVSNATHTGDVTGSTALTIANNAVTTAKIAAGAITDSKVTYVAASKITGILPVSKGGTGSDTQNFVDLTTAQTIAGAKTFSSAPVLSSTTASKALFTDNNKNIVSNEITGTGNVVMSTSPTMITPALGTPSALVGTNITGTAAGLNIGGNAATVTTNANLTGVVTSTGNATSIANGAINNSMLANTAVANLSGTNTGDNAVNSLYSGLVTNATHTGDVTGSTALTIADNAVTTAKIAAGAITDSKVTDVAASKITGTLPVSKGGTGSETKNFVDLLNNQRIAGEKFFDNNVNLNATTVITNSGQQYGLLIQGGSYGLVSERPIFSFGSLTVNNSASISGSMAVNGGMTVNGSTTVNGIKIESGGLSRAC